MKKIFTIAALLLALPVLVFGAFSPATLTNGVNRVAVTTQEMAQKYFGMGYVLETKDKDLGAVTSPTFTQRAYFNAGYNYGGTAYATSSTAATYTVPANTFGRDVYMISWTPNVNTTLTLPATTSASFINIVGITPGESREYILYNASSTAAASITLAAGAGIDLQKNEDTADLAILGLDMAKLTFIRKPNKDVMVLMEEYQEAD